MSAEPADDPDALRADIAHARADLADTVEALAAKPDVTGPTKEAVSDLTADTVQKGRDLAGQAGDLAAAVPGQLREDVASVRDLVTGDGPDRSDLRPLLRLGAICRRCRGSDRVPGPAATPMSRLAATIADKPVGLILSAGAGLVAGVIFKQIWKLVADHPDAPKAVDEDRTWA